MASSDDRTEIIWVLRVYHAAMVDARTDDLKTILDEDFSLVHITGYVQPKTEWFDVVRSAQFDYHSIRVEEQTLSVTLSGDTAVVSGRGIFEATINGMRNPWRLQFTLQFARRSDGWKIVQGRYTTF